MTRYELLRRWVSHAFGSHGAVANCRRELERHRQAETTVDQLVARLQEVAPAASVPHRRAS